jgi:hypothetical protein
MKFKEILQEIPYWREYLSDALLAAAIKLHPDNQSELNRAEVTYDVCMKIAKGELHGKEAAEQAYAAVY